MPYFKTAQEWVDQSKLLLEARPATTRITTRYSIKPVKPRKNPPATATEDSTTDTPAAAEPKPPRGSLVIKTYDPESGVVLKYRTTKAAEVSRLIQSSLGSLGRGMAALPPLDETMADAPAAGDAVEADGNGGNKNAAPTQQGQTGGGGGGGKKKKKGKK